MKTASCLVAAALFAASAPVSAQTVGAQTVDAQPAATADPGASLTFDLNSAPPSAQYSTQAPIAQPAPRPAAGSALVSPTGARLQPAPTPPARTAAPAATAAPARSVPPATASPQPLSASAIAALPFTVQLPAGFQIIEGRSTDSFNLYTIRRASGPVFVSVYAGELSDYPIYAGREITAGGRTSVLVNEGQGDRAVEHIFLRASAPREVHIWVGSVPDAERAVAEAIAQSVDVR